jgi:hypothetical protein
MSEAAGEDDAERDEEAERRGGLDPAGPEAAAVPVGRVFGDIGGGAAVFPAEREALQESGSRRSTMMGARNPRPPMAWSWS